MLDYIHRQVAPHNPGRAGRIAAWLVLCALILGAVGFIIALSAVIAIWGK
jgi:hypothetical protein